MVENRANTAAYRTAEECYAIRERLVDSVEKTRYTDTLVLTPEALQHPYPPVVIEAVRQCAAKFSVTDVSLPDWMVFAKIFLAADRTSDVRELARRRLAAIPVEASAERLAVLDSLFKLYIDDVPPARFDEADSLLPLFAALPSGVDSWIGQLKRHSMVVFVARKQRDTLRGRRAAERVVAVNESLTEKERSDPYFASNARGQIFDAYEYLGFAASLDSLRTGGSKAFVAAKVANWNRVTGGTGMIPLPVGHKITGIAGMWFDSTGKPMTSPVKRPTSGKISLVVFYNGQQAYAGRSFPSYATLRRLHQRFPDLEINILTDQTFGYLGPRLLTDTLAEAQMLADYWIKYHKIPAALAVEPSPFWRLPNPDRRRINQSTENPQKFRDKLGLGGLSVGWAEGYLVDRDGVVLEFFLQGIGPEIEPQMGQVLDVLMRR